MPMAQHDSMALESPCTAYARITNMTESIHHPTLYYVHDPMCSWCWAFRSVWEQVRAALPGSIRVERLLGGLAPDTDQAMPPELQAKICAIWRHIQAVVPGTEFNYDFWRQCRPRRSTYPACRAVIAAKMQGTAFEEPMIFAIQRAYYRDARNPSDSEVLIDLAATIGLDASQFADDLTAPATHEELTRQIDTAQRLGAEGFPSLILVRGDHWHPIRLDYNDAETILQQIC